MSLLRYVYGLQKELPMTLFRRMMKPVAAALVPMLLVAGFPVSTARAAMVATQGLQNTDAHTERNALLAFSRRADVRAQFLALGVDPGVVQGRITAMTDGEIATLADRLEALPAGGNFIFAILIVWALVSLMGYDKLFLTDEGDGQTEAPGTEPKQQDGAKTQ
jgi:hypothetical protein